MKIIMKLDARSFLVGIVFAVAMYLLFGLLRRRTSFYDGININENMTYDEARNLRNTELRRLMDEHAKNMETVQNVEQGDKFVADHSDAVAKLEAQLAIFEMKKSQKSPAPSNAQEAPPVEESAFASPAASPAPETPSPAPQTSTYEIEPYHG
jgi:hypothetical protein